MSLMRAAQQKKDDQAQPEPKDRREKPLDTTHISPIAAFVALLAWVAAVIGAIMLKNANASELLTGAWAIVLALFGI